MGIWFPYMSGSCLCLQSIFLVMAESLACCHGPPSVKPLSFLSFGGSGIHLYHHDLWWDWGTLIWLLGNVYITMGNDHGWLENSLFLWSCSIAMWVKLPEVKLVVQKWRDSLFSSTDQWEWRSMSIISQKIAGKKKQKPLQLKVDRNARIQTNRIEFVKMRETKNPNSKPWVWRENLQQKPNRKVQSDFLRASGEGCHQAAKETYSKSSKPRCTRKPSSLKPTETKPKKKRRDM